jgi:1-aminocyclopropane-1-carboxylate deaminase
MMDTLKPNLNNITLENWNHISFLDSDMTADVLRLDKIHPEISGNKWFKLKYFIEKAHSENKNQLISFGGAYSNHLLALSAAARLNGFSCVGIIRGEEPLHLSHTLQALKESGMELRFLSRADYALKKKAAAQNRNEDIGTDELVIPEGGAGIEGILGAEEILSHINKNNYSHICCAVGTGTTLAGILNSAGPEQKIVGVSVLKGTANDKPVEHSWIKNHVRIENLQMIHDGHFGGYAKYTGSLIQFMNDTFRNSGIPTDFVYTGKLFYAVTRMAAIHAFPEGSRILILHTGGLQGNCSLPAGLLQF